MAVGHMGIVWNPSKTTHAELETALAAAIESSGVRPMVTWAETDENDAGSAVSESLVGAEVDLIVAAGGDGTVRAVAEYLGESHSDVELAIAPLGTGNLLARNLGVPMDPSAAFERALTAKSRRLDLGWAELLVEGEERRYAFTVMAGFGIDAHMITETKDDLKERAGWLAYVESLGRAVSASEVIDLRISFDQEPAEDARLHTLIVGNCGSLQAGFALLPDADPFDGELDVLMLDSEGIGGWLGTLGTMIWDSGIGRMFGGGKHSERAGAARARSVAIELDEPRVFEVDGDELGVTSHIAISVQPGAVRIR